MSSFLLPLLLACQTPTPTVMTSSGAVVAGDTFEARAEAAWARVGAVTISEPGTAWLAKVNTPILVDVPEKLTGLPEGTKVLDLRADPAIKAALMGSDEKAAADLIRATGARAIVVHTDPRPSMDRGSAVLSHLYHHDELAYFQLARVENGALVYLVTDGKLAFPAEVAGPAIQWVRESLAGKKPAAFPPVKPERSDWQIVTSIRRNGQELAVSLSTCTTLDRCLTEAVTELEAYHRRNKEVLGLPKLMDDMDNIVLEMHRITERAAVVPRDEASLKDLWEMGMDGDILLDKVTDEEKKTGKKGQSAVWPGSVAVNRSYTGAEQFLKAMAREFRWDSVRPWRDEGVDLFLIRTTHWLERPEGGIVPLYRAVPPVPMDLVNLRTVRDSIILSGEWYLANLKPDGLVTYKFWPEENRYSNEYNHVRHTLATWNLWQAWTLDPRPEFLEGAQRASAWTMQSLVIRDGTNLPEWERKKVDASPMRDEILSKGMAYYTFANNTKLGSVVVDLLGLLEVAKSTNDHSKDELFRQFGRYVLFSLQADGSWDAYHVPPGHPADDDKNDIVPGEAALALVNLYEYFNDEQYLDPLPKFFSYYEKWFDTRAARKKLNMPWPAFIYNNDDRLDLVQFGPWSVMAAAAYTRVRPEATDIADFEFRVARWMIESYGYTSERTPYPDYIGGYYKFEGELPAMQAFCYGEGTAAAYDMALRMRPSEAAYFEKATRETVRFGMMMQHNGISSYPYTRASEIEGGTKYAMNEPKVRIDYVYHAQSTLYQWLMAAQTDPNLPAIAKAEPTPAMAELLEKMDYPSFRKPGAPVRTSVPPDASMKPQFTVIEDAEGGE